MGSQLKKTWWENKRKVWGVRDFFSKLLRIQSIKSLAKKMRKRNLVVLWEMRGFQYFFKRDMIFQYFLILERDTNKTPLYCSNLSESFWHVRIVDANIQHAIAFAKLMVKVWVDRCLRFVASIDVDYTLWKQTWKPTNSLFREGFHFWKGFSL